MYPIVKKIVFFISNQHVHTPHNFFEKWRTVIFFEEAQRWKKYQKK